MIPKLFPQNFCDVDFLLYSRHDINYSSPRHKLFLAPENINYVLNSISDSPARPFYFLIHPLRRQTLFGQFPPSLLLYRSRVIARLHQFDTRAIDIVCHEIRRPTGVLELHFGDGGKNEKGARCGPRSFSCGDGFNTDS